MRPWPTSARLARGLNTALARSSQPDWPMAGLLLVAAAPRLLALTDLESGILAEETLRLDLSYQILAGHGPGPLSLTPTGEPTTALYPTVALVALLGPSYLSARLASVFASLLALGLFMLLARRLFRQPAALAATTLLAFSPWYLAFSRQALPNVWVLPCLLGSCLALERGLETGAQRHWIAAGLVAGLACYAGLPGALVAPSLVLYLLLLALVDRKRRARALAGALPLITIGLVVSLPLWPTLVDGWVGGGQSGLRLAESAAGGARSTWAGLLDSMRAYVLLDPASTGDGRLLAEGQAPLGPVAAALYFVGLLAGLQVSRSGLLAWCLLAPIVFLVQPAWRPIPDLALALPLLGPMFLLAGLTADGLLSRADLRVVTLVGLTLATPLSALANWSGYVEWQRAPASAEARQPALDLVEFDLWRDDHLASAVQAQPTKPLDTWLRENAGRRAEARAERGIAGGLFRSASEFTAQRLPDFGPLAGLSQTRGLALDANGTGYVLDADGRVLRFDAGGRVQAVLPSSGSAPRVEEPSDLALGPDGTLLLLDAGRGRVDRFDPNGALLESYGATWGMYHPRGLGLGPDGRLYVADTGRDRVLIVRDGAIEQTIEKLDQPTDVVVDPRGWLYVVQPDSSRLSVLNARGQTQATWKVERTNTVDGPHLAYLSAGALALTDPEHGRVLVLNPDGRPIGQVGGPGEAALGRPYAVAANEQVLLVGDSGRAAVRAFSFQSR